MSTEINIKKRIDIQEEGVSITPDVNSINFTGDGVTASAVGNNVTVTIAGAFTGYDYEIHVSQVDGNNTTGNGSLLNPVASITKALTLITAQRRVIVLHPGGYTENPTVSSGDVTIQTTELTGGNTVLYGTLTIGTAGSGGRISGFSMNNLAITGTAQAYVSNCTINTNLTKSSSGYVEIINTEMQCTGGIQISGSGITIINGNKNVAVSVSNASAQVILKGCNSVVTPSASAGNLAIVDCIVTALGGNGITITGASTTLTLLNSQVLVTAGNNVAPISVAGIYSIINTIYDKPSSTLTGTSTNSIDYFQYINADKFIKQGGTSSEFLKADGSVDTTAYQAALTLTTTGTSGAATFITNTLNVPTYTLSGLGGVPSTRNIIINGTTQDLSADRTWNVGTVTSAGITAGTGISLAGTNPITSSGTITVTNSAPDQVVALTAGTGISVTGTYPNFTIDNTGALSDVNIYNSDGTLTADRTVIMNNKELTFNGVGGSIGTQINLSAAANRAKALNFEVGTSLRWKQQVSGVEIGGDNGSQLAMLYYDDAGASKGTAFSISRTNGAFRLNNAYSLPLSGGTTGQVLTSTTLGLTEFQALPVEIQAAASDEITNLTIGTSKVTFRMPHAMTLTAVRASLTTAQTAGALLTVDINLNGVSVLGTKLTFDNNERTTVTAATPATIVTSALTDDGEITVDIDAVGTAGARGLKITLIGTRA